MAYADLDQLKADYISDAKSSAEISALSRILDNVSAFVDTYCRRPSGYFNALGELATKQKIRNICEGSFVQSFSTGIFRVSITARDLPGSPVVLTPTAGIGDTDAEIAAAVRAALADHEAIADFFNIGGTGVNVDLETKTAAENDPTMELEISETDPPVGQTVGNTVSTIITEGDPFQPASIKRVRGEGQHFLRLPVHVIGTVEEVTLRGSVIDTSNYYESDRNGWLYLENTGLGLENIFLTAMSSNWADCETFDVTARWGYTATPLDIAEAVRQIVMRIWETQKGVLGQLTPNGFVIERAMPPFAKEILDRYRRREFEI